MIDRFRRRVVDVLDCVDRLDRAVNRRVSRMPRSVADSGLKRLTHTADHGVLWFLIAFLLAGRVGATRKAALRAVASIAGASFTANAVLKPLLPRRRPPAAMLPRHRRLADPPTSSSFPSGHAASAAAFTTAVAMESPKSALAIVPLAATVAYSRVHVGVHWSSDVISGAALGAGIALGTRRWWPVRRTDEARARRLREVPRLVDGKGLVLVVNTRSGDPDHDPTEEVTRALPSATVLPCRDGGDITEQLQAELVGDDAVSAIGVAGGDGTVAAAAAVAAAHDLPLVVVPTGTLNHFARDVGVYDLGEAVDATGAGEAVAVGLGVVDVHPDPDDSDPDDPDARREDPVRRRYFINTASLGSYPELVELREQWQLRWGKWPAFAAALVVTLRKAEPVRVSLDGDWHSVWFLFIGNGPYEPRGAVPAWRTRLDSGHLDVRWLRADLRFSRLRAICALAFGALGHSRVYGQREVRELDVALAVPGMLAADGEVVEQSGRFTFRLASSPIAVYRRDEHNPRWSGRERPHLPR